MNSNQVINPHAMFFENVFSQLDIAANFIENYLPKNIVTLCDFKSLELSRKSFVSKHLKSTQSDALFKIKTIDSKTLLIYILIEHKSYIDRWVLFQVLGYILQIGERERMMNKVKRKRKRHQNLKSKRPENEGIETEYLTPVIPIIVYHGQKQWDIPKHLYDIYQYHDHYKYFIPDFDCQVINLTNYHDDQIIGMIFLRVALLMMKYYFRDDLDEQFPKILSLLRDIIHQQTTLEFLELILRYIGTKPSCDQTWIMSNINKVFDKKGGDVMTSVADIWINKGIDKGKKEGKKEGQLGIISTLFEERFGKIPSQIRLQMNQVDDELIDDLVRSLLRFHSIDDYYLWWDKHFALKK